MRQTESAKARINELAIELNRMAVNKPADYAERREAILAELTALRGGPVLAEYETQQALLNAYRAQLEIEGMSDYLARLKAIESCKYVPHLYRGGYVIPGFGYSTERIGRYVVREAAGSPEAVR